MKVFSQLISASLENRTSDYSAGIFGRFWLNTTVNKVMTDDGTLVRALLRNDQKCVFGNSGTASQNIRFQRGAAGVLQFVTGDDTTAEGSLSTSIAQLSMRVENYATGSLPAASASNKGRFAFDTTTGGPAFDNGGTWIYFSTGSTTTRVNAMWDFVVGSAAQVTAGTATHSTLASAVAAAATGNSILILQGTTTDSGTVTISIPLFIHGHGVSSVIPANIILASGTIGACMSLFKVNGNVTANAGSESCIVNKLWLTANHTPTDNGNANSFSDIMVLT